jgi:hypothetical protein
MLKLGCAISDKVSPKLCRAIKLDFQKVNSALAGARFALMASKLGLTLWELQSPQELIATRSGLDTVSKMSAGHGEWNMTE